MSTPTVEEQVSVNGLLMGPGTPYELLDFDAWSRQVRHAEQDRAWDSGSWSGREDDASTTVPLRILTHGDQSSGAWLALHWQLVAAFRASSHDVELRYLIGGTEYVMFGRPRMIQPEVKRIGTGMVFTKAAFQALDPRSYSAIEHTETIGLPSTTGGLMAPFTAPFTVAATVIAGSVSITNAGTAPTGLLLRIDANAAALADPRVSLQVGDDPTTVLRANLTLSAGQWLELDTKARTARLNGTTSRSGQVSGTWPLLQPGTATLGFDAGIYSDSAQLTATWRDAW